jgi:hypothetical protein
MNFKQIPPLLQIVIVFSTLGGLFIALKWPLALLALVGLNAIVGIGFRINRNRLNGNLACATAVLIFATLYFTDWGLSMPHPVVRVAWPYLIAACVSELALIVCWIVGMKKEVDLQNW